MKQVNSATKVMKDQRVRQVKYTGWSFKQQRGPVMFLGATKKRVFSPDGTDRFAASILRRTKGINGRKCRVPVKTEFFDTQRKARETALLWLCEMAGIDVARTNPAGEISSWRRRKLLVEARAKGDNVTVNPASLSALQPYVPVQEHETLAKNTRPAAAESPTKMPEVSQAEDAAQFQVKESIMVENEGLSDDEVEPITPFEIHNAVEDPSPAGTT